jgi:hypothetical protein
VTGRRILGLDEATGVGAGTLVAAPIMGSFGSNLPETPAGQPLTPRMKVAIRTAREIADVPDGGARKKGRKS